MAEDWPKIFIGERSLLLIFRKSEKDMLTGEIFYVVLLQMIIYFKRIHMNIGLTGR